MNIEKETCDCPCKKADPDHFLTNEQVTKLLASKEDFFFSQEDYLSVYNCIHCNDCGMSEERFELKRKFLEDGNTIDGLAKTLHDILEYGTPFSMNKSRVKQINGVNPSSETLLYLGCFTTVKTPKYAKNIIKYLLKKKIEFTILEEEICCGYPILCNGAVEEYRELVQRNRNLFEKRGFKKIITACPSCYMVFKKEYSDLNLEVKYFTEFLTPLKVKKEGNLLIQHACPLRNGKIPGIVDELEDLYEKTGFKILKEVPYSCCGGGIGHQLRTDVIDAIATARMEEIKKICEQNGSITNKLNFITAYCPDAFWILKVYGKKAKIPFQLRDMCDLLLE
ncbi:MAG: (Fe-S)-binding protein [Candidatus Lokiarchaeota archaeon]|nr:(Fe-S)-binding protein [Candidatus Lokiarchaeota archaeon]